MISSETSSSDVGMIILELERRRARCLAFLALAFYLSFFSRLRCLESDFFDLVSRGSESDSLEMSIRSNDFCLTNSSRLFSTVKLTFIKLL